MCIFNIESPIPGINDQVKVISRGELPPDPQVVNSFKRRLKYEKAETGNSRPIEEEEVIYERIAKQTTVVDEHPPDMELESAKSTVPNVPQDKLPSRAARSNREAFMRKVKDQSDLRRKTVPDQHEAAKRAFVATIVPSSFKQVLNSPEYEEWKLAMDEEMATHIANNTVTWVERPPGRVRILTNSWIFSSKHNELDEVVQNSLIRLVVHGNRQGDMSLQETYAPTIATETIRIILSLGAAHDREIRTIDFKSAFLNAVLEEEVYTYQPKGYEDGTNNV
ncbi:DNA-directed DNA polymerase [Synchytrium endobioticum]|uniref:DNA-directed DNA polymerase n=1 Tax=Synchytrium endobioticum TaxID=286115 RepID=A0A507CVE1_9FUNG|nr:DNA-directed DNA polymerase [Synchytrium endobioticum]TPX49100.1 DNA-directed DNA polymerase [Synchytrium endobioticum]